MAYASLEPFGEERADMRSALVAATVANAFRSRKEPFQVADFMLRFGEEQASPDPVAAADALKARFRAAAKRHKPRPKPKGGK